VATEDHLVDQESTAEQVAWAGLPINLDWAFSQAQRDKVYAQHLMRNRWRSLRNGAQAHERGVAAEFRPLDADAGQTHIRSLSAGQQ
jgi:hypothetical protein